MTDGVTKGNYRQFAAAVRQEGLVSDPWFCGQPRLAADFVTLSERQWRALAGAAEAMAAAHQEMVDLLVRNGPLFDEYFALGPVAKALWQCSAPVWHCLARADLFWTKQGLRFCEINCDTPSGQAETVTLSRLFRSSPGRDANTELEARFCGCLDFLARQLGKRLASASVGILYPTEFTEDLGLVLLYERWITKAGAKVVLGSPFNLSPTVDGRVAVLGQPCDIVIRHYKADWWVERQSVWSSEASLPDCEPLTELLALLLTAEQAGKVAVVNPFGAIVPQNKRSMALLWEELARFSPRTQETVRKYLPPSFRLERMSREELRRNRRAWVLKSDYGCEGEETIVGRVTDEATWDASLTQAVPRRWIAQQAFDPLRDNERRECNFGVYLVAGMACGLYARRSVGPTDAGALSTAVRIGGGSRE